SDEEDVLRRIDIRLRFVQPNVIKPVRFHVAVANPFPEPLGRLGIRGVDIRPDDVFEASRVRLSVWRVHQPAFAKQHVVELSALRKCGHTLKSVLTSMACSSRFIAAGSGQRLGSRSSSPCFVMLRKSTTITSSGNFFSRYSFATSRVCCCVG